MTRDFRRSAWLGVVMAVLLAWTQPAQAEVKKIVVEKKVSPAFEGASFGAAGQYETLAGRAFGELDPNDPHNAIITDIRLAPRNANGKVEYVASFFLVKPIDMSKSSRLMWHDVPNRGGRVTIAPAERDCRRHRPEQRLAGRQRRQHGSRSEQRLRRRAGREKSGRLADHRTRHGTHRQRARPRLSADVRAGQSGAVQAGQSRHDERDADHARLREHRGRDRRSENDTGHRLGLGEMQRGEPVSRARPIRPQICLKNGFDPELLYQVVFTAKDPYVLGIGFAAFRDVASFFRNAKQDDGGTPNPLAGNVSWVISRGRSQSGNFLRAFMQLGFTQDEDNRKVYDGAWPIIAGRRVDAEHAFRDAGWRAEDVRRRQRGSRSGGRPGPTRFAGCRRRASSIAARPRRPARRSSSISAQRKCGDSQLSPSFVGTSADKDIPAPGERSPLLHSEHAAWRRRRWVQRRAGGRARLPGRRQLRQGHLRRQSGAAHRNHQRAPRAFSQLGDEGDAAARERLADARWRVPR